MTNKYVSLKKVLDKKAHYNLLIGERSNGKTTAALEEALRRFKKSGGEFVYLRRWDEDVKSKQMSKLFDSIVARGVITKIFGDQYNMMRFFRGAFYLAYVDDEGTITSSETPCGYALSLTAKEHYKSISFPKVTTVVFDEFLTDKMYLPDEYMIFMHTLSTIIRSEREDVVIFMCGNTVNHYSPYFKEMGLTNIKNMQMGDIDVYTYGGSDLKVCVYFTDSVKGGKKSNVYFAFNNPRLNIITGKGNVWEMDIYPHKPEELTIAPRDILLYFFIVFEGDILQCEIIHYGGLMVYIHRKTTPIQNPDKDIVFSPTSDSRPNYYRSLTRPVDKLSKKIISLFSASKIFYQDNEIGETVKNYLLNVK